jgi:nucleoside-diphosphate-sugar epimerase
LLEGISFELLVRRGHAVTAMARSSSSASVVEGFGATSMQAELGRLEKSHLLKIDAVVHAAAYVEEFGTRAQFFKANVEGTRNVLEAAASAGVKRLVHVGTEAALFNGRSLIGIDESAPYPSHQRFLYSESKAAAERLVLAAHDPAGMTTISIRPRFVWGPRDTSVLPALLRMAKAGSFAWLDGGVHLTSTCHVGNLVHALELALTQGIPGRAYFVTDGIDRTLREVMSTLADTQGVTLPSRSMPGWFARAVAAMAEPTFTLLGKNPPLSRFAVAMMSSTMTVRDSAAKAELGYSPVMSIERGLAEMRGTAA